MSSQELITIVVSAGYDVEEYETHYCVHSNTDFKIVITIPRASHLVEQLVEKVNETLGL